MNADTLAKWMKRQGLRVSQGAGSHWVELAPRIFQSFPFHRVIQPDEQELKAFIRKLNAIGVRYSAPVDSPEGMISYHVVYAGKDYSLEALPAKARYDVRKGLSSFRVEPIALERLATEGWEVRHETLVRQGRTGAESRPWWEKLCRSANGLPGSESWGAIDAQTGRLAGSLLAFTCDNCFCILYQQSRTEYLRLGVNNVLSYVATKTALAREGIAEVFYGLHSLDAPASVDEYKFRMGFTARPVRQRVVFHPWIAPLLNATSHRALQRLHARFPERASLAKAEGMFRFRLEGRKPLAEQVWPDALAGQRASILSA